MPRIIAIANQKGGIGKTTSVVNIAAALFMLGKNVAVIDIDAQGHTGKSMGIDVKALEGTIYDVLIGKAAIDDVALDREGICLLPSNRCLTGLEATIGTREDKYLLLKKAIEEAQDILGEMDYILIDCPPSLDILTLNALNCAHEVFVPVAAHYLALEGLSDLWELIEELQEGIANPGIKVTGIFMTMFSKQKRHHNQILDMVKESLGEILFKTRIREGVALQEAPSFGQTIFEYAPKSNAASDYLKLAKEIVKRGE